MKSFREFITEARGGKASEQAMRMGLVSDGHGGWVNRQGNLIAQTEKDRLVFIKPNTQQKPPAQQPAQKSLAPVTIPQEKIKAAAPLPKPKKQKKEEPAPKKKNSKIITVVFAKFNPPTAGHLRLLKKAREVSGDSELRVYPSRAQNQQNPLDPKNKIRYMRLAFPEFADEIINDQSMSSIFDVLSLLYEEGYKNVRIVVGAQREAEFDRLANQYNGQIYEFENIEVVPAIIKDPDSDSSDAQSSGAVRKAAIDNDYFKFKSGLPAKMPEKEKKNLFNVIQKYYEGKSSLNEMWKVSPSIEDKNLRENYYKGNIFNVGDLVESQITGLVGRIKRRGPNYLICVNEELNIMFKPWIQDVAEWTVNCGTTDKEKEVGRPERLKYLMRLMNVSKIDNYPAEYLKKSK